MQNTLFESGFSVQIYFTNNTLDREKSILEGSVETGRCGRSDRGGDKERIAESEPGSVPAPDGQKDTASVFQYLLSKLEAPHVSLNDAEAAYKAVRYLIDKGIRRSGAILKLDDGQGETALSGISEGHGRGRAHCDGFPDGVDRHGRIEATWFTAGQNPESGRGMHRPSGIQ